MSISTILKTVSVGVVAASAAFAFAQGTPPTSGSADPATGAGQRSSQDTSMGTTGVPTGPATAAGQGSGSMTGSTAAPSTGTSAGSTATMSSDSGATTTAKAPKPRADRN